MVESFRQRTRDMRALTNLGLRAEKIAGQRNEMPPGAEHFLLAALDMPDGTARAVFERIGREPNDFVAAIDKQYAQALQSIGIEPVCVDRDNAADDTAPSPPRLYQSKPDVAALYKEMYKFDDANRDAPLLGASVVAAIASLEHGVAARALRAMQIDRQAIIRVARELRDNRSFNSGANQ